MRRFFFTILFIATTTASVAAQAPVQGDGGWPPAAPKQESGLTISDCLGILAGLNSLDGRRVIVGAGKSTESAETVPYKFSGKLRNLISHDIFVLGEVQQEAQAANRRAQLEIGKGDVIRPGTREALEFDQRMAEYTSRPCNVALDRIPDADLALDLNDVSGSVLGLLWKIRDR